MKKKRYNFTLDEDLMNWLKVYCKENRTTCSAFINQSLVRMKNGKPKLPSVPTKPNR
jgi:hypothetical protein